MSGGGLTSATSFLALAGAALGELPLFWTLIVPIAVAVVIACGIAVARRQAYAPA